MAAIAKNRNFFKWPKLLYFKPERIEQFWPFEEISILSNGSHLGYKTALTDTILKGDNLGIMNCRSIMMSFLTYITGFFMNFELLPILTDYAN
jgi:hypothetical protein